MEELIPTSGDRKVSQGLGGSELKASYFEANVLVAFKAPWFPKLFSLSELWSPNLQDWVNYARPAHFSLAAVRIK